MRSEKTGSERKWCRVCMPWGHFSSLAFLLADVRSHEKIGEWGDRTSSDAPVAALRTDWGRARAEAVTGLLQGCRQQVEVAQTSHMRSEWQSRNCSLRSASLQSPCLSNMDFNHRTWYFKTGSCKAALTYKRSNFLVDFLCPVRRVG